MGKFGKQTVLIVHNYYQIPGGEDTVVANEKQMLEEHGHKVVLYSRNNSELKEMNKFKKALLPVTTIFNPRTYKDIKQIIKKEHIDIVHVHNTLSLISPSVYYAAMACKVPVVQTVHNFRLLCPGATFYRDGHICEDCVEHGLRCAVKHSCYRGSKVQTLACVINTMVHRITGIYGKINYICLTEFNKDKLLNLKEIDPKKVFVKPNFTYRQLTDETVDEIYYLFIGRVEKIKGLDILLKAFAEIPNQKLVIAGTGTQKDYYEQKSTNNVQFVGFLNREQLTAHLAKARAVIVPSQWYETFGMIIAEAYAAGKPVIVGDIGNIASIVDNGITGLKFTYDSADALIDIVKKFESISDVDWRKNVLAEFQNRYSPERNYEILSSVYKKIDDKFYHKLEINI